MTDTSSPTLSAVPLATPPFHIVGHGQRGWNTRRHGPTQPISAEEAADRHAAGQLYGVVLGADPGGAAALPVVDLVVGSKGITVAFHEHDPGKANLTHTWVRDDGGRFRLTQVDRRNGNGAHTPRDRLVYEYLKLTGSPALWCRVTDAAGLEVLEERDVDLVPFDADPPAFGAYDAFLDRTVSARLWPGLPELPWVGPDVPVTPRP